MAKHPQTFIKKYNITCDAEIAELIEVLNDYGFETVYSCQGEKNGRAYIMFKPDSLDIIEKMLPIFLEVPNAICEITKWVESGKFALVVRQNRAHFDAYADLSAWTSVFIKTLKNLTFSRN